jgi:ABC-type branched-subunit amino acid transport system substrate-binding protein
LVATVFAVAVSACGGASPSASSTDAAKTSIKVMTIAAIGNPLTNYPDVQAAAKAAVDAINKAGGVNGHKIEWTFCNTQGQVNQAQECARTAVRDQVVAVVGRADIYATASNPILEAGKIVNFGGLPLGSPSDVTSSISYPLHEGNSGSYSAIAYGMAKKGAKKFVTVSVDLPIAFTQIKPAQVAATDAGMQDLGIIKVPAQGVTDYAPYAQQVKQSGADAVLNVQGPGPSQSFIKAMKAIGSTALIGSTIFSFGESEAQGVGDQADGYLVASPFPSIHDTSNPGIKLFNAQLDAGGAGNDPALRRSAGLNAWLAMHALAKIGATIKGDITAASMASALQSSGPVDLFGILSWDPSKLGSSGYGQFPRFPPTNYTILTFKSGKLVGTGIPQIKEPLKVSR